MYTHVRLTGTILAVLTVVLSAYSQFNSPESAVWDNNRSRWLISNAGNGCISQVDSCGDISNFAVNLNSPKGLCIVNDTLYVADVTHIRGYLLSTREALFTMDIPESEFLNDVTADDSYLFISDTFCDLIYRMNLCSHEVETYVTQEIGSPNGLYFDREDNRLLLVSFRVNSPVQQIDLRDGNVSTIIDTELSNLDGISRDGNGNYYVSSWGTNAVYRLQSDFSNQVVVADGFNGPADIFYDTEHNILAIPLMTDNRLILRRTPPPQGELRVPPVVCFESTPIFTVDSTDILLLNSGGSELQIDSATHSGDRFELLFHEPVPITPGNATPITITFSPVDTVEYIDTVLVYSNEPRSPRRMILNGRGFAPNLVDLENHNFNKLPILLEEFTVSEVYPSPFNLSAQLTIKLLHTSEVEIDLYRMDGKWLKRIFDQKCEVGYRTIGIEGSGLAAGSYVLRGKVGGVSFTKTAVLTK